MHTNDAFVVCGSPTLGRTAGDPIEVSAPPNGWYSTNKVAHSGSGCGGDERNFKGDADRQLAGPHPATDQ